MTRLLSLWTFFWILSTFLPLSSHSTPPPLLPSLALEEERIPSSLSLKPSPYEESFKKGLEVYLGEKQKYPYKVSLYLSSSEEIPEEGYYISREGEEIRVVSRDKNGAFWAGVTLGQWVKINPSEGLLPSNSTVKDYPRFSYRGLMLDVSRHFIPKEEILRIIRLMAMVKLNHLHLHLVDDNGWRFEVRKYPLLTTVGASRPTAYDHLPLPMRPNTTPKDELQNTGFYTQDDLREIVQYAQEHMVQVVPEIEVPAHTISSLAAYPDLACDVAPKPILVPAGAGAGVSHTVYCAGKEEVFSFLEDVLDEVMEIFPSPLIHIGGDEASRKYWKQCPKCQKRIREEGLKDETDLQAYFMNRVSNYLKAHGRKSIGWDEVTYGKIPEDMIVMGWQGKGHLAHKAVDRGHQVILCPAIPLYFIRYQGPQWYEPYAYFGNNTLRDVYDYAPLREGWKQRDTTQLLGIQGALWSEFATSTDRVEYLLLPRLLALGEVAWGSDEAFRGVHKEGYDSFLDRSEALSSLLRQEGYVVAPSPYNIKHSVRALSSEALSVRLAPSDDPREGTTIRYQILSGRGREGTLEGELKQGEELRIPPGVVLQARTYRGGKALGVPFRLETHAHKAVGATLTRRGDGWGDLSLLTNGVRGSEKATDGEWIGPISSGLRTHYTLTLPSPTRAERVEIGFCANYGMTHYPPLRVTVRGYDEAGKEVWTTSKENEQEWIFQERFERVALPLPVPPRGGEKPIKRLEVELHAAPHVPKGYLKAGDPSRLYIDEIELY